MALFNGLPLNVLEERLGPPYSRRVYGSDSDGHVRWLMWACNGEDNLVDSCRAISRGEDSTTDPEEGWQLTTCSRHGETFSDFPLVDET